MKVRFLTLAQQELDNAVVWYKINLKASGKSFLTNLTGRYGEQLIFHCLAGKSNRTFDAV